MMDDMDGTEDPDGIEDPDGTDAGRRRAGVSDGVEHLQRAAREVIAAARSFLDAVEAVVDDDERLSDVSNAVGDVAATVLESLRGASRSEPWVDAAWRTDRPSAAGPTGPAEPGGPTASDSEVIDLTVGGGAPSDDVADGTPEAPSDDTEEWARPLIDADAPRRPSRVRRIAVD